MSPALCARSCPQPANSSDSKHSSWMLFHKGAKKLEEKVWGAGQHPPIHYQEQPLDGNLHLFPWNSSIKSHPRREGAIESGQC